MNTKKRIAFSIVAALAIFMTAAILAHYCYGMLPESLQNSIDFVFYASAILFESTTAIVAFFISGIFIAAVFIVFFFIFFLLLGIKKDYSQKITELIEETQTEVTKEYLENIEILPWEQVLVQLEQRKQLLIDELKSKYGQKSLKYIDLIDSSADESWKKIEGTLRKQKLLAAKRNALSQQQEPVSSAGIGLRLWGSLGYSGESEDDFDIDEDFLEELNEPDEINPLEVIGELEEIEELESSAESVDNGDFDVIEQLEVVDENLDELEEPEELDDMEEMEELEEIETRDP